MKIKIGFIGYKGHAIRLMELMDTIDDVEISYFYHPEKEIDIEAIQMADLSKCIATRKLEDLYSCDGIIVSTPNHTHFHYLKKLTKDYKGYIFCEKPPVSNLEELEMLNNFSTDNKRRIYFNFNMRFSYLKDIIKDFPGRYNLGDPIRVALIVGHGLALKESYKESWRAKKKFHRLGVLETLGIHYFDLFSFLFGSPDDVLCKTENHSPYGDSIDTCHLSCLLKNRCYLTLTCSYCIPCTQNIQIDYTNGSVDINSGKIKVFGPREIFDENGFFIAPPLIHEETMDQIRLYQESLKESLHYFISCARDNQNVDLKCFEQSMASNKLYLKAEGCG